jgi:hypothetical protein
LLRKIEWRRPWFWFRNVLDVRYVLDNLRCTIKLEIFNHRHTSDDVTESFCVLTAHNYFLYKYYEMGTGWAPAPEPEPVVTVPEPEPVVTVPEPEPEVPVPEPEPEVPAAAPVVEEEEEPAVEDEEDVPVARSAALIEEALNAGASTPSSQ